MVRTNKRTRILPIFIVFLFMFFISGCAPSESAIATAIAETQASYSPTPTFTLTPTATATQTATATPVPSPTPTPKPTHVPIVLYSDDFSNNQSGWIKAIQGNIKYQYSGGQYVISRPKGNMLNWANANRSFTDAVLTVEVIHISGNTSVTGPIIIWRYVDNNNFYVMRLAGNGYFTVEKLFRGNWQTLYDWTFSTAINKGQQVNKIVITFGGSIFTIFINSVYLATITDSAFTTGDIGLGASSDETSAVEVSFDNLIIYTIDSWTPPDRK